MNYQNLLCLGDSQTFGARTYGCYPLHLARILTEESRYAWRVINWSTNGYKARDLWFQLNERIHTLHDTYQACLLIGTNDVGENSDPDLFEEYYRQILRALLVHRFKFVFCGLVPPIQADGHAFFARTSQERRSVFDAKIRKVCAEDPRFGIVELGHLEGPDYVDPVHLSEPGNVKIARAFADAILAR